MLGNLIDSVSMRRKVDADWYSLSLQSGWLVYHQQQSQWQLFGRRNYDDCGDQCVVADNGNSTVAAIR